MCPETEDPLDQNVTESKITRENLSEVLYCISMHECKYVLCMYTPRGCMRANVMRIILFSSAPVWLKNRFWVENIEPGNFQA